MLEIMTLICRITLATTQTLTSPGSKGINVPAIQAGLWREVWTQKSWQPGPSKGQIQLDRGGTSPSLVLRPVLQCQADTCNEGLSPRTQQCLSWDFLCICRTIIHHTRGKTNTLLAWISIQGGIIFTGNSAALRTETPVKPFSLLLIYLLFTHANKNPILSLLYSTGCRQDGKEVTMTAPNWFMYLAKSDYKHQTGVLK